MCVVDTHFIRIIKNDTYHLNSMHGGAVHGCVFQESQGSFLNSKYLYYMNKRAKIFIAEKCLKVAEKQTEL